MKVSENIFRAYDIRGVYPKELNEEVAFHVGRAFGSYMIRKGLKLLNVAMDCRLSSEALKGALIEGLTRSGCHVLDVGVVPTPLLYFSIVHTGRDGGVMITASHNPPEFNGFKLCIGRKTFFGDEIQGIRETIEREDYVEGAGSVEKGEIVDDYVEFVKRNVSVDGSLRIAIDGGNGVAGPVALRLFKEIGLEVYPIYCEADGRFPNHHPDPVVEENLEDLKILVNEKALDLGVGYDGDGDRIGVVDDKGRVVWGDRLLLLFSLDLVEKHPGAKVVGEVKCSQVFFDELKKRGGIPIMWRTGHSYIKEKLEEENALLAGEMSGHMFFRDRYFGFDDAIYASARLLELLSKKKRKLSELVDELPSSFSTPEIRIDCPDGVKFKVVEMVKKELRGDEVVEIDGVRVSYRDGSWALVRASNTQPALVLRFEARSLSRLEELRSSVISLIDRIKREVEG